MSASAQSLCPVCLMVLDARHEKRGEDVFLCRTCPEHGPFEEVVWRGPPAFDSWRRPKTAKASPNRQTATANGCPHDCGICPAHEQHACTVLYEITTACDLNCPVCFAASGGTAPFAPLAELAGHLPWIREQAGDIVLQLSGGEPTLYPELPKLVREAKKLFSSVQLNTNGLRLAEDPNLARALAEAGLSWVFLQFDGVTDATYIALRGRPLLREKLAAIKHCAAAGLPVILVPTLAAGVNNRELGPLLRLALDHAPGVRGLHVQPMTFAGRNHLPVSSARITLPEVLTALCEQSDGLILPEHATPPGCEHERCSFHCRYRLTPEGGLVPLRAEACCTPMAASEGVIRAVDTIRRSWGGVAEKKTTRPPTHLRHSSARPAPKLSA